MLIPNVNPNLVLLSSVGRDEQGNPVIDEFPIVGWIVEPGEHVELFAGAVDKARPAIVGELDTAAWAVHDRISGFSWMADGTLCGRCPDPTPALLAEQAIAAMTD